MNDKHYLTKEEIDRTKNLKFGAPVTIIFEAKYRSGPKTGIRKQRDEIRGYFEIATHARDMPNGEASIHLRSNLRPSSDDPQPATELIVDGILKVIVETLRIE